MRTLTYLYGIVPSDAPDPPPELRGIDEAPVRLVRAEQVSGVVSDVAEEAYGEETLDERLADLAWVGARGLAHERVLDWYADRGPLIPLSLFSLHAGEKRVRERLAAAAERHLRVLARLRGRREWGVKLWREEARALERLGDLSPAIAELGREIEEAPPGRKFLLEKKRDALRGDELRRVSARISHEVYGRLSSAAEGSALIPIPAQQGQGGRTLVLHTAFLVPDEVFPAFQNTLSELAAALRPMGYDFEFSGPWPAYHFGDEDG